MYPCLGSIPFVFNIYSIWHTRYSSSLQGIPTARPYKASKAFYVSCVPYSEGMVAKGVEGKWRLT